MKYLTFQCPTCGKKIKVEETSTSYCCLHCGTKITLAEDDYEEVMTENFIDKYQALAMLGELKEKGILNEEEFNAEKVKVLNGSSFVQPRPAPNAEPQGSQQPIIINNANSDLNATCAGMNAKNKWIALLLCVVLGVVGAHKFYEGKILFGIVYLCTAGLFGVGVLVDFFVILFNPNPYYC